MRNAATPDIENPKTRLDKIAVKLVLTVPAGTSTAAGSNAAANAVISRLRRLKTKTIHLPAILLFNALRANFERQGAIFLPRTRSTGFDAHFDQDSLFFRLSNTCFRYVCDTRRLWFLAM